MEGRSRRQREPSIRKKTCEAAGKDGRDGKGSQGAEESRETSKLMKNRMAFSKKKSTEKHREIMFRRNSAKV